MKIMTSKLVLLRWLVGLAVAVMVSGCILPPPWMRELDPWALTNMTPDERPAEEINWIEFEVQVSEHVKRVVVYGIAYNNGNRSCDSWALDKGGSLLLGEGSSKFIVPSVEISLYKDSRGLYVGSQLMPLNEYLPGHCDWRPNSGVFSLIFHLQEKYESRKDKEWGGGVFSPSIIISDNCMDAKWAARDNFSYCLTNTNNEIVIPRTDNHCSKRLGAGRETDYTPLLPRVSRPIVVNNKHINAKTKRGEISILMMQTVQKIKFIYNCNEE